VDYLSGRKANKPMDTSIDVNAVLNFAGGLLGFAAVVITVFVQFWRRTSASLRSYFHHVVLMLFAMGVGASAIVAKFIWESRIVSTFLFDIYIILLGWEFSIRDGPLLPVEIAVFVIGVAFTVVLIAS
jgi:hypothetical protein